MEVDPAVRPAGFLTEETEELRPGGSLEPGEARRRGALRVRVAGARADPERGASRVDALEVELDRSLDDSDVLLLVRSREETVAPDGTRTETDAWRRLSVPALGEETALRGAPLTVAAGCLP